MALANLSIYYTWKNIKTEYNNNKFKISTPTWNETFDLPDGSYSIDDYQHTSKVLFTFVPNKKFGQLLNIFTIMNTVNTEFSYVEVWFTDQRSKALEIEDNINLTLIIRYYNNEILSRTKI